MDNVRVVTSDDLLMDQVYQAVAMGPEERIRVGSELFLSWVATAHSSVKANFPSADAEGIEHKMKSRLDLARMLEGRVPA